MATAKQLEANRLNALLSTGPKTDAGKAAARRNALKHGLAGAGIVMPIGEEELVQERTAELCSSLKPLHTFDLFLTEEVALEQLRAERCRRLERARRQRLAEDALEHWDEQRIIAAEQLGARLSKEPALSVRLLQRTLQGCDWLLERWRGLGRVLEGLGAWDDAQRRLALDLLGTPPELRRGGTPLDAGESSVVSDQSSVAGGMPTSSWACPPVPDIPTKTWACHPAVPDDDAQTRCVRVVIAAIERLTRLRDEVLEPRDEAEQRAAFYGEGVETDPELQLLHRYEACCQRRKAWALKQLNKGHGPSRAALAGRGEDARASRVPPSPLAGEGAISHDSTRGYLDLNESAHPTPPLFEPFLPPISGGAPTANEGRDAPPSLRGLREHFLPRGNSGNRRPRRARGRF